MLLLLYDRNLIVSDVFSIQSVYWPKDFLFIINTKMAFWSIVVIS